MSIGSCQVSPDWPARKMPVKKAIVPILPPKSAYEHFLRPYQSPPNMDIAGTDI
jgi:hypothetical protein